MKLYVFQTVPLSIRSFSLYTHQWYMSYRFADSLRAGSEWNRDGQRNCLKHVEFCSKNKFEKLVHLVYFIIRNVHDVWYGGSFSDQGFLIPCRCWDILLGMTDDHFFSISYTIHSQSVTVVTCTVVTCHSH